MSKSHISGPLLVGASARGATPTITDGLEIVSGNLKIDAGSITIVSGINTGSYAAITAGTTQTAAGATAVTTSVAAVTVGNASDGIILPTAVAGKIIHIVNLSNAAGKVYAQTGDTINNAVAATGVALATGSTTGTVTVAVATTGAWTLK